jgi:hypothetical protein
MRYIAIAIFSFLTFVSCSNDTSDNQTSRFYDDGRARPIVSICSVIDSTSCDLPWSLSEELTQLIRNELSSNKNIYVSENIDEALTTSDNPFDSDVNWMKNRFEDNEFLVFLELLKHNEIKKDDVTTNLDMSVRLRIIDVRAKKPKVILQECISDNYYITKGAIKTDYQKIVWGSSEYTNSRMGMAHKILAKLIAERTSDYIALAKSR